MDVLKVVFSDGREMAAEPGLTFTGTDTRTGKSLEYICFTDNLSTGPFLAKKKYVYYFKVDSAGRIIYSDHDSQDEYEFVAEALGEALDCPPKGLLCLFELVKGGIKKIEIAKI